MLNRFPVFLVIAGLVGVSHGQDGAASNDGFLTEKAMERFHTGERQLVEARARIEAEKLPMMQKLSALEETLAAAKKKADETRRQSDLLRLESTNIATEVRLRTDENGYLGNILDEFVRGFETRIHAGEFSTYEASIKEAKLASENTTLPEKEKFNKRMRVLEQSLDRLDSVIGGLRFETEVLDPNGVMTKGTMVLIGPNAVFSGASDPALSGIVTSQTGSNRPVLRTLDPTMTDGIHKLVTSSDAGGWLPFDPTQGAALQQLIKKTNIIDTFLHGGPIMWPILVCSIIALGASLERMFFIFRQKTRRKSSDVDAIFDSVKKGSISEAVRVGTKSKDFVAKMMAYALDHPEKSLLTAIQRGTTLEIKRFTRGLWILDTCITMAPLLGLLGTVTGMMGSFEAIGAASDAASGANSVIGGIAEALIATAAGLLIAIVSLIPLNYLNDTIEEVTHELEDAGRQLELIFNPAPQIVVMDNSTSGRPRPPEGGQSAREETSLQGLAPQPS